MNPKTFDRAVLMKLASYRVWCTPMFKSWVDSVVLRRSRPYIREGIDIGGNFGRPPARFENIRI